MFIEPAVGKSHILPATHLVFATQPLVKQRGHTVWEFSSEQKYVKRNADQSCDVESQH